jgi:hypothetical protein
MGEITNPAPIDMDNQQPDLEIRQPPRSHVDSSPLPTDSMVTVPLSEPESDQENAPDTDLETDLETDIDSDLESESEEPEPEPESEQEPELSATPRSSTFLPPPRSSSYLPPTLYVVIDSEKKAIEDGDEIATAQSMSFESITPVTPIDEEPSTPCTEFADSEDENITSAPVSPAKTIKEEDTTINTEEIPTTDNTDTTMEEPTNEVTRSRSESSATEMSDGSGEVNWEELEKTEEQEPRDEGSDEVCRIS